MSGTPSHLRGAMTVMPGDRIELRAARATSAPPSPPSPHHQPMDARDIASLREWLATWGDGPNWVDRTGASVAISKATVVRLIDEIELLRSRQ